MPPAANAPAAALARPPSAAARARVGRLALALLALCPLLVWSAARLVYALNYRASDFFTFWLAARMQWTGQDPYSPADWLAGHQQFAADWIPNALYPYPLPLALLLAPLGLLPLDRAYIVWISLALVLMVTAVMLVLLLDWQPRSKHYVVPLLIGLLLFRPVWVSLRNGQLGGLLVFVVALAACCWEQRRWLAGGLVLALLALKPTFGFPVLGLGLLWLAARRQWAGAAGIAVSGAALLLIAQLQNAQWLSRFLGVGQAKLGETFGYSPTLWGLAGAACGHTLTCTLAAGGLLAGGLLLATGFVLTASRARPGPLLALSLSLPAALLVMPYGWAYDQALLLVPLAVATLAAARAGFPYLVSALLFFAVDLLAIALLLLAAATGEDTWSALVPLVVWVLALWAARRPAGELRPLEPPYAATVVSRP